MTEDLKQVGNEAETVTGVAETGHDGSSEIHGSQGAETLAGQAARVLTPPPAGQTEVVRLAPGERFEIAANPTNVSLVVDGDNLVLGFDLDGDGQADSFLVLEDLVITAGGGNPPVLLVAGEPISTEILIGSALARSGVETGGPGTTLETAAGPEAIGGGNSTYSDNLGETLDLLAAQGVIPPVALEFRLIELEDQILIPEEAETPNSPPQADPVLTPASQPDGGEGGGLPPELLTALSEVNTIVHSATVTVTGSGQAGSVQYVFFTLTEPTAVTITTDGPTIDPHMFLFADDGSLDAGDILGSDDDDGLPAGLFFNSVINTGDEIGVLPAGNYIIAVGDYQLTLAEAVAGINNSLDFGSQTGDVTITIEENDPPTVVFFKQLDVDGSIGDDDSGVIADFGGNDAETSLENLVFTLQSNPTFGQLILVTAGGDTSYLTPGDMFSSEDTVWWVSTEEQIANFLAQPGAPEFLPDVNFLYTVTDEGGASDIAPVVITLPPPTPPRAAVSVFEGDCLNEDTEGQLYFEAHPTDGASKISQIVLSGFPTGDPADAWVVDENSVNIFGYTLNIDYTASYDAATGELTITFITANFSLGETVSGIVDVTPNPDSDVDIDVTIEATAINGAGSAVDIEDSLIPVDADADGAEGSAGDDGDGVHLSILATASDSNDDGNSFQPDETGSLNIQATFDDFLDGSETHTIQVFAPTGFAILAIDPLSLPAGVTLVSNDGSIAIFDIDTTDGVGSVDFDIGIQNTGAEGATADFLVRAMAEETNTGDVECVDGGEGGLSPVAGDNVAFVEDVASVSLADVAPPDVLLSLYGDADCIEEDSTLNDFANVVSLTVTPDGDDEITEIVISGFQAGWTYDLNGLETDGATLTDNDPSDGSITLSVPNLSAYSGSFAVQPPQDSDVDHPTLTATATVVDPTDPTLTENSNATIDIAVDAVADGGAYVEGTPDSSTDGSAADLNLTLTPRGHASGTPDDENGGGFDTDGSESITKIVVTLSGDAGAVLTSSDLTLFNSLVSGPVGQEWTFEGSEADLVALMATLQVDPADEFEGDVGVKIDVTTTEFATEAGAPNDDGTVVHGEECDDDDNNVTESFNFTVTVADGPDPTGGTLSLIVDEAALDEVQDAADLQAGNTTGTDPGSVDETDDGTLVFNAGGDDIVDIYFGSDAGIEVRDENNDLIAVDWTGSGTDTLVGKIGGVTVIVLSLSGESTAAAGGTANSTVTATLTDAFPHDFGNTGNVTITGIEVDAEDSDGDTGAGTVDVTVLDDEPEAGTSQTLILSNTLGLSGTADLDFILGADGPGGFSLTKAMAVDGTQTALVEGAAVYGFIDGSVVQLTSNEDPLVWHDNSDGTWSAVVDGNLSAVVFTVSVNPDGTYTVELGDEPLDGAFSEFQLAFTSGVKGGNDEQLIFFDSTESDANPVDGIPDGSTIMALATAVDSDGTSGTVNSSTNGMGVSQGNTIDVNAGVSEKLFLDFGEPVDPALIDGKGDPDFTPRLISFATITFNILDNGEFAIVGVEVDGVGTVYFKVAGFGNGASAANDVFLTIDQGTTGDGSLGGDGSLADPYEVDMNGQFGTAFVDGAFATLEFQADVATESNYRLLSAQGIDTTSGTDVETSFTAEAIDDDGDTAEAVFDVTFDAGNDLVGTAGDDVIVDNGGANTISDGDGNDTIIGGNGADIVNLAADGDTDILVYDAISEAGDVVSGFSAAAPVLGGAGGDIIDLVDLLDSGTFTGTTLGEAIADGYVSLVDNGGSAEISVDLDGSAGGGGAVLLATLNGVNIADLADNIVVD